MPSKGRNEIFVFHFLTKWNEHSWHRNISEHITPQPGRPAPTGETRTTLPGERNNGMNSTGNIALTNNFSETLDTPGTPKFCDRRCCVVQGPMHPEALARLVWSGEFSTDEDSRESWGRLDSSTQQRTREEGKTSSRKLLWQHPHLK